MMNAVDAIKADVGTAAACRALTLSRATFYRHRGATTDDTESTPRPTPERALKPSERQELLAVLRDDRFVDKAPAQVYAILLDEGRYLCSPRTMYRVLAAENEVRERRDQLRHPDYKKPELIATGPNQVWSWDITKLMGPVKWTYFHLYVMLDIFSRYVVGWMVAPRESATLAIRLVEASCEKQGIQRSQLNIHADRGTSMMAKSFALFLADLGVTKTHSRPHVSNDNPFSEAQFKTLKYRPDFPERFGSIEDARAFCQRFFHWYNTEHRHSAIGLMTPEMIHYKRSARVIDARQAVLTAAYASNPERFVRRPPVPPAVPTAVWINPPEPKATTTNQETDRRLPLPGASSTPRTASDAIRSARFYRRTLDPKGDEHH
jgi:putative transposase